mgnify:CR=1 FL=1
MHFGPFLVIAHRSSSASTLREKNVPWVIYALLAAALFSASTPLAKELLGDMHPITLAGLLYAGSGAGLAMVQLVRVFVIRRAAPVAWPSPANGRGSALRSSFGGIFGPILLMSGLVSTAASTASLLLERSNRRSRQDSHGSSLARISTGGSRWAWQQLSQEVSCCPSGPEDRAEYRLARCSWAERVFAGPSTTI